MQLSHDVSGRHPKHAVAWVEVRARVNGVISPKDPPADEFSFS